MNKLKTVGKFVGTHYWNLFFTGYSIYFGAEAFFNHKVTEGFLWLMVALAFGSWIVSDITIARLKKDKEELVEFTCRILEKAIELGAVVSIKSYDKDGNEIEQRDPRDPSAGSTWKTINEDDPEWDAFINKNKDGKDY